MNSTLSNRLRKLESEASTESMERQIIVFVGVDRDDDGELRSEPVYAWILGLPGNIRRLEGESAEDFDVRLKLIAETGDPSARLTP